MPAKPPPLPEAVYQRVISVSKIDGYSILILAGLSAFMAASAGNAFTAVASCLAAGAGALEISGSHRLALGDAAAVNRLVRAQLLLLAIVLVYAIFQLTHFDAAFVQAHIPELRAQAEELSKRWRFENPYANFSDEQIVAVTRLANTLTCFFVCVATCLYQGLMARYYHKRRAVIAQALGDDAA